MKKLALFAMLLGSTFVFGCENKPAVPAKGGTPSTTTTDKDKDKDATPAPDKAGEKDATPAPDATK